MLIALLALLTLGVILIAARIVTGTPMSLVVRRNIGPLVCKAIGHRRDRESIRKLAGSYQARCRRCDHRLVKANRQDEWVPDRPPSSFAKDFSGKRQRTKTAGVGHTDAVDAGEEGSA